MDSFSKPQGVPLSATPKASLLSSSSGSSSFLIRAPLTVDSDTASSYGSDDGFESDGSLSDELKFDNAFEKPVVATPDNETSGNENFLVSGPILTNPNEKISEKSSSNVEKIVVSGPYHVSIPDRIITMNRVVSRRFLGVNDESLVSPLVEGKDVGETKMLDDVILSLASPGMPPVAKLSRDSDEDSVGDVFEEDDGFSGVARNAVIETLEKFSAPEAQVLGVGERDTDEDESQQFTSILESEVSHGLNSSELLNGVFSGAEEMSIVEMDSLRDNNLAGLVKDEGSHIAGDAKVTSLVESEVSFSLDSSALHEVAGYSVEETQGLENMDQAVELYETNSMNSGHNASVECTSTTQGETALDGIKSKEVESEVSFLSDSAVLDEAAEYSVEEIHGLENMEQVAKSVLESEVSHSSISSELLNGVLSGAEEMSIGKKDSIKDNIVADLVKDEGPHIAGDAKVTSLVESEESFVSDSSVLDEVAEYSVEEIHGLANMEQVVELYETNSVNLGHNVSIECSSTSQRETALDSIKSKEVVEGGQTEDAGIDELSPVIYFPVDSSFLEANEIVGSTVEVELVNMTGLEAKVVKTVDEKNVSYTQGEEVHKPGGDIAIECDITYSVFEENAKADQDVNADAICVYNLNCETNGGHVNENENFGLESKSEKVESIMELDTDVLNDQIPRSSDGGLMDDELCCKSNIHQPGSLGSDSDHLGVENKNQVAHELVRSKEEEEGACLEDYVEGLTLGESNTVENIASEIELVFTSDSFSGGESSYDHSKMIDEHFVTYSDEDADAVAESEVEVLFDSAAFSALPDVARGSETDNSIAVTFADDLGIFTLELPADLNSTISSTELTAQTDHPILSTSTELDYKKIFAEHEKNKFDVQQIRVKYLGVVQRLGLSAEDFIAAQVLHRLDLTIGRSSSLGSSQDQETLESAAVEFESDNLKDLDFFLNILIIGKSGVGKSATINSIFGEDKTLTDPFEPATTVVKEIVGTIDGIKVRVLDTPGLRSSLKDQSLNRKILKSIGRFTKKCPPDVVIYVDRLDIQSRDLNDLPLLRSITSSLGSSIWYKTIITLTHAASTPPDGPSGEPLSYKTFVALRSHVIQQLISHVIGGQNMVNAGLVSPVCLVENHGCKKSIDGQDLLPNGEAWKPQLLLLCYSMKILSELNSIIKAYKTLDVNKLFEFPVPSPPLPYFLSSLLQSCDHLKYPADQGVENLDSDIEMGGSSECQPEDEEDYDRLPPFNHQMKFQIGNLSKEQRKVYFEDYDYGEKLIQKKQWREDVKRLQEIKKNANKEFPDFCYTEGDQEDESSAAAAFPVTDMALPPFDGYNPNYRYQVVEDPATPLLAMPSRGNEYRVEQNQTTSTLSLMRWRGDLVWGCNMQSQYSIGRNTKMVMRAGVNNKKSGQVSVRISSSEQLQIALVVLPIVHSIFSNFFPSLDKDC